MKSNDYSYNYERDAVKIELCIPTDSIIIGVTGRLIGKAEGIVHLYLCCQRDA